MSSSIGSPQSCFSTKDSLPDLDLDFQRISEDLVRRHPEQLVESCIREAEKAGQWTPGSFRLVENIQQAARNHGMVQKMELLGYGLVAVKRMPISWTMLGSDEFTEHRQEETENPWLDIGVTRYLNKMGFEYVPFHMGVFRSCSETFVVSSLAATDMFSWLMNYKLPEPGPQREKAFGPIMSQIILAVGGLHELGIAHCDLSLENILLVQHGLDGHLKVQLIDFCVASVDGKQIFGARGKPSYIAPELHSNELCCPFACDVFSSGVVLYMLAMNSYPWMSTRPGGCKKFCYAQTHGLRALLTKVLHAGRPVLKALSPCLLELLEGLLAFQVPQRLLLTGNVLSETYPAFAAP
eukprot:TRINITY_DN3162_c0_g1_i1.p1 TRINITY_DN3162_c0_g1~~TRINITY_DN3162_c0_g1_i1.p1  ORF type:complete len:366 (-),score=58.98 TRINITY_DN3162_c0_g1_i1:75-1130(-)